MEKNKVHNKMDANIQTVVLMEEILEQFNVRQ